MRAGIASGLSASNRLFTQPNPGMIFSGQSARLLQLGPSEDEKAPQVVLVEILDRVEKIAVESHHATDNGANSRVTVRLSVRVHPWGGIIRSAWSAQREYPNGAESTTRSSSHTAASPYENVIRAAEGEPHRTQLRTMASTVEVGPSPFKDSSRL
jgi:hypothetical protein